MLVFIVRALLSSWNLLWDVYRCIHTCIHAYQYYTYLYHRTFYNKTTIGRIWVCLKYAMPFCSPLQTLFQPHSFHHMRKSWLAKGGRGHKKEVSVKSYGSQRWEGTENVELREGEKNNHLICALPLWVLESWLAWISAQFFSVLLP